MSKYQLHIRYPDLRFEVQSWESSCDGIAYDVATEYLKGCCSWAEADLEKFNKHYRAWMTIGMFAQ